MAKLELHMTLDELKRRYANSAEKAEDAIDILADLNDTESTFIAFLLYHMGCPVPSRKMPRSPRTPGVPTKEEEYRSTEIWRTLEENGITMGTMIGSAVRSPVTPKECPDSASLPKVIRIWIAYLRDQYSTAILSDEDLDVLRKLQTIF